MFERVRKAVSSALNGLQKEITVLETLHGEAEAALRRMERENPGLRQMRKAAAGYAVFPSVGKATAVIGAAFGMGEVFEGDRLVGYAAVAQLTVGVQLGGQTLSELVLFESPGALRRFKAGKVAPAAAASAVLVKAGAGASAGYEKGVAVFVRPEGGMMLEAAVGAQKFFYRPAVLGRGTKAETGPAAAGGSSGAAQKKSRSPRPRQQQKGSTGGKGRRAIKRQAAPRRPRGSR
jgi:hypothetical protein